MTATNPNIREALDQGLPNQTFDLLREINVGDVLSLMIASLTPTESAAGVVSHLKTLTNAASAVYDVVATAGTVIGRKKLLKGQYLPAQVPSGYVAWDGGALMTFSAADAVTASNFTYTLKTTPVEISLFSRNLGQRDTVG